VFCTWISLSADHGRSDWLGYWVEFVQKARFKKLACLCHIKQNDITYLGRVCTPCLSVSVIIPVFTLTVLWQGLKIFYLLNIYLFINVTSLIVNFYLSDRRIPVVDQSSLPWMWFVHCTPEKKIHFSQYIIGFFLSLELFYVLQTILNTIFLFIFLYVKLSLAFFPCCKLEHFEKIIAIVESYKEFANLFIGTTT